MSANFAQTLSLLKRRLYWPGMEKDVQNMIHQCGRCIRRKTAPTKKAELVNITTSSPMELVCIDFLSQEPSKGGHETICYNWSLHPLCAGDSHARVIRKQLLPLELYLITSSFIMAFLVNFIVTRELILNLKLSRSFASWGGGELSRQELLRTIQWATACVIGSIKRYWTCLEH